jgi:hypothetical protein
MAAYRREDQHFNLACESGPFLGLCLRCVRRLRGHPKIPVLGQQRGAHSRTVRRHLPAIAPLFARGMAPTVAARFGKVADSKKMKA